MEIIETILQRQKIFLVELDGCFVILLFREFKKSHNILIETNKQEEKMLAVFAKGLILFTQKDYLQIKKVANALRKTDWKN